MARPAPVVGETGAGQCLAETVAGPGRFSGRWGTFMSYWVNPTGLQNSCVFPGCLLGRTRILLEVQFAQRLQWQVHPTVESYLCIIAWTAGLPTGVLGPLILITGLNFSMQVFFAGMTQSLPFYKEALGCWWQGKAQSWCIQLGMGYMLYYKVYYD